MPLTFINLEYRPDKFLLATFKDFHTPVKYIRNNVFALIYLQELQSAIVANNIIGRFGGRDNLDRMIHQLRSMENIVSLKIEKSANQAC